MTSEAEKLIFAANTAAQSGAARTFGLAAALSLLVSWVLSVEARIERLEKGEK